MQGRVFVGTGMSEEFSVNISLRHESALSPLMFIMVMELVSRKVSLRVVQGGYCAGEWVSYAGGNGGVEGGI